MFNITLFYKYFPINIINLFLFVQNLNIHGLSKFPVFVVKINKLPFPPERQNFKMVRFLKNYQFIKYEEVTAVFEREIWLIGKAISETIDPKMFHDRAIMTYVPKRVEEKFQVEEM